MNGDFDAGQIRAQISKCDLNTITHVGSNLPQTRGYRVLLRAFTADQQQVKRFEARRAETNSAPLLTSANSGAGS